MPIESSPWSISPFNKHGALPLRIAAAMLPSPSRKTIKRAAQQRSGFGHSNSRCAATRRLFTLAVPENNRQFHYLI
jgi:hypothetical protein